MPDGKHAFLGSGSGGDVLYAIDISDPAHPTVTDSIVSNTRRVNDVMTHARRQGHRVHPRGRLATARTAS